MKDRRAELETLDGVQIVDLLEKYNIDLSDCKKNEKRSKAIEKILEYEGYTKPEKKKRPPRNHAETKIKALRLKAGLTQSELADSIGINLGTLKHYEQGSRSFDSVKFDVLFKACTVLDCKVEDLLENEEWIEIFNNYTKKALN